MPSVFQVTVGSFLLAAVLFKVDVPVLVPAQRRVLLLFDRALDLLQDPSAEWADQMNGAFYPAQPTPAGGFEIPVDAVQGQIPADLDGTYLRVGPNVALWPPKKRTHVFDGDGMVHSVRLVDGTATYHCAYLNTPRYKMEQELGQEYFLRIGEIWGIPGIIKMLTVNPEKPRFAGVSKLKSSTANTAIGLTPHSHLWALNEAGLPFRFRAERDGSITSLGYDDLNDTLAHEVSAHPKFDYKTEEIFFHGKDLDSGKFHVARVADGKVVEKAFLHISSGFQHDMFITHDYVVIIDGSMRFDPENAAVKKPLWTYHNSHKLSFYIYPRALNNMTADNFINITAEFSGEIVHTLYGYNDNNKIILYTPIGFYQEGMDDGILGGIGPYKMHRIVIDVTEQTVTKKAIKHDFNTEFGRVQDKLVGANSPAQFGFSAIQATNGFDFTGIYKWDFKRQELAKTIRFPPGVIGGEPVFVPRARSSSSDEQTSEDSDGDNGYISMFLWNPATETSQFVLYDATTFDNTPVVALTLPVRVPLGFHGLWVDRDEMEDVIKATQKAA